MKLLNTALPTILAMVFLIPGTASCEEYDMTEVNAKVNAIIVNKKLEVLEISGETFQLWGSVEFQALRAKCTTDWQQIAASIDKVQGGDEAKKLVIYAFENLAPQDYMTALETIVTQYEGGKISDGTIQGLLHPKGRMCDFLVDNHAHSRVAALLNRIKAKTKDAALKKDITEKLDGTDKASLDAYRSDYEGTSEAGPPPVILPP